jgi:rhodanese-related sulfurtransferase
MTLSARQLAAEIASGAGGAIVDVRSSAEFTRGHVPGAINLPFQTIATRAAAIPSRRDARLVVYCGHGPRAWIAGRALRRLGFTRVVYLKGHMAGWKRAGLPEERG